MDGGGAKDVDDDGNGGVGALGDEGALKAFEGTTCDTDGVAFLHAWREVDGTGGVEEHVLELTHLVVGDDSEGSVSLYGIAFAGGGVEDVEKEEGAVLEGLDALLVGGADEDVGGDDDFLDLFLVTALIEVFLGLGGDVGFVADGEEFVTCCLLGIVAHDGDVPLGRFYSSATPVPIVR